jgi:hypothetical protein
MVQRRLAVVLLLDNGWLWFSVVAVGQLATGNPNSINRICLVVSLWLLVELFVSTTTGTTDAEEDDGALAEQ